MKNCQISVEKKHCTKYDCVDNVDYCKSRCDYKNTCVGLGGMESIYYGELTDQQIYRISNILAE